MAQIGRPGLSAGKKDELWRRFQEGESFTTAITSQGKVLYEKVDEGVRADSRSRVSA